MIDMTVPERGAQPREVLLEVITATFDAAMELADAGARPPQLQPSIDDARRAQKADDHVALDRELERVAVAAIATRVRLRAATAPDTPDGGSS